MVEHGDNGRDSGDSGETDTAEKRFNDTLKRMLQTPPKPHDKAASENRDKGKPPKEP